MRADGVRVIPGYMVWAGVGASVCDAEYDRCPVAQIAEGHVGGVLSVYRRIGVGGVQLGDVVRRPTDALLASLEVVASELVAIRAARRAREKAARGGQ